MDLTTITSTSTVTALTSHPGLTVLAATDLLSGGRALYTILVYLLVLAILGGGGTRAAISFFGGRIGSTIAWALVAVIVAVIVGAGYPIYMSTKRTVDTTGITTGQFGV